MRPWRDLLFADSGSRYQEVSFVCLPCVCSKIEATSFSRSSTRSGLDGRTEESSQLTPTNAFASKKAERFPKFGGRLIPVP